MLYYFGPNVLCYKFYNSQLRITIAIANHKIGFGIINPKIINTTKLKSNVKMASIVSPSNFLYYNFSILI